MEETHGGDPSHAILEPCPVAPMRLICDLSCCNPQSRIAPPPPGIRPSGVVSAASAALPPKSEQPGAQQTNSKPSECAESRGSERSERRYRSAPRLPAAARDTGEAEAAAAEAAVAEAAASEGAQ